MTKRYSHKENNQRGSATVEGVIAFVGFLFVIFTLLNVINYCRAQMLISSAVDTAAKELAQYSYFYKMSGLQKFNADLSSNASVGKDNINQVIGTVDDLYKSVAKAGDNSVENITNITNATSGENLSSVIDSAVLDLQSDSGSLMTNIESLTNAFQGVADDPLLYMRSIVAIASQEAMDEALSHLIAAPLSRMFVQKHFGKSEGEADAALERLGVVDGMDGMDFSESTVFADGSQEIRIVVFYKLKLVQFFDNLEMEVSMSKQASCRAWLGGDNILVSVPKTEATTTTQPSGGTEENQDPVDPTEETTPEETTEPTTEATEEATEPANSSTGFWALTNNYYESEREKAFKDLFENYYGINTYGTSNFGYNDMDYPDDTLTSAHDFDVYAVWPPYGTVDAVSRLTYDMQLGLDALSSNTYTNWEGEEITFTSYMKVIYVPENMPEDQMDKLYEDIKAANAELEAYAKKLGMEDFEVTIYVQATEGTYDYENGSTHDYDELYDPSEIGG